MTVYYVPNKPIYNALAVITQSTAFVLVARRVEFWVFVCGHVFSVFLVKTYNINTTEWSDFKWDLISINVLFMTVFLTFYNGSCFNRHQQFYETCMRAVDSMLLFVREIVTSLPLKDHHKYRVQACKYTMAMLHISFLVSSTGNMKRSTWREMQRRGLLDKGECDLLASFPAVRSPDQIMILANWAMQVVDAALAHEVPAVAEAAVHTHTHTHTHVHTGGLWMTASHSRQRLNRHVTDILTELHSLGDLLAMPVPFPYYHAMNVVIVTSLILFSFMATLFKTYFTVFPFAVSLLFLLAIREISTIVTDPFRADDIGFPFHSFLEYCFDHSCCLLLSFNNENAYTVASVVEHTEAFSTEEITHQSLAQDVFSKGYDQTVVSTFAWNTEMPIRQLYGHVDKTSDIMTSVFNGRLDRYRRQQEQRLAELDEVTSQSSSRISVSSKRKKYKVKAAASKGSMMESTHFSRLLRVATHRFVHEQSVDVDLDKQELAEVEREIRLTERDNAALERQVAIVRGKLKHVQEMLQKLVTVAPVETDIKDVSLIPQRPKPRTEPETHTQEVEEEVLDFLDARRVIADAIDALRLSSQPEATPDTTAQLASPMDARPSVHARFEHRRQVGSAQPDEWSRVPDEYVI